MARINFKELKKEKMRNAILLIAATLLSTTMYSQIEVISNGNVLVGNSTKSDKALNVEGHIQADAYVDKNNGAYYLDANSTSKLNILHITKLYDRTNTSYSLDLGGMSHFNMMQVHTIFDRSNGGFSIKPSGQSVFNTMSVSKIYDRESSASYIDPASNSKMNTMEISKIWDRENGAYYLNMDDYTKVNKLISNKYFDGNNTGYYLDLDSWSNSKYMRVQRLYGRSSSYYFVDPQNTSRINSLLVTNVKSRTPGAGELGGSSNLFANAYIDEVHYNTLTQLSDERTKENIKDMENPLEKLMALTAKTFDYKSTVNNYGNGSVSTGTNLKNRQGFIAQEVKEVIPEIVQYNEKSGLHTMNYVELIPMLVKALQEQEERIQELEKQLKNK